MVPAMFLSELPIKNIFIGIESIDWGLGPEEKTVNFLLLLMLLLSQWGKDAKQNRDFNICNHNEAVFIITCVWCESIVC